MKKMARKLLSVKEFADLHGKYVERILIMIHEGRIKAEKIGRRWVIEEGTPLPQDERVKSGKYVGTRSKYYERQKNKKMQDQDQK